MGYGRIAKMAIIIRLFVAGVLVLLCLCFIWNQSKISDAQTVNKVPPNYIALKDVIDKSNGILNCVFWEGQISFYVDVEEGNICIYQAKVNDGNFIVKYKDNYYINATVLFDGYNEFARNQ